MNSNSDSNNSLHPHSLNLKSLSLNQYKKKVKNSRGIFKNNLLYEHQRKKGSLKYLEKYIHRYFISFYKNSKNDYNIRMIEDILNNESTHLVAEFKDYLIMGDITEFLQKSYNIEECKKYLPKIYDYYNSCSVIFPNYVKLHESKYIYKNIRKKQKVIDNQQEQEEKQEKIKNGEIKYNENEDFLTTKTFYSILDQTNTSNIKLFFGINNEKIDANETPNDIVEKLQKAEKEAIKKKINLIKNNSKLNLNLKESNTIMSLTHNKRNNSKVFNKNKSIKERNKNNNNKNIHYLSHIQKKKIHSKNNSNINIKMNLNERQKNKIKINNYLTKENDSKKYIKSSSSINDTENDINRKKNYITFYGNKLINSKRKETKKLKKLFYEKSNNKHNNIFINSRNNSNKNIKKKFINSLLPTKVILSRLFNNFNNSILAHNSYINKKLLKKHITEENKKKNNQGSVSPSSITIQANSFRKMHKYNINLKESKSTRNIINDKININYKLKEKVSLKNIQPKIRNKNYNFPDYNSNTLPASTNSKTKKSIEVKNIKKSQNINPKDVKIANNFTNFKTIVSNTRNNSNINTISNNNINNGNKLNFKNMQKINSTSNIKNPMDMNININMSNNTKNKIYLNEGSCTNIIDNKLFSKSPFSFELETIKVTKRKRILYPKKKTFSDISNKKNNNENSANSQNLKYNVKNNKINNTISKDKNNYLDSLVLTSSNSNNINDEFINNGFGPSSTINYINTKKDLILEELYKKKNIIMPYKKEINNINININGYNIHGGALTSRTSNNVSKTKNKKYKNKKEINFYNNDSKIINKNGKHNNLMNKKDGNPVKIRKIYENIKSNHIYTNKSLGNKIIKKK